ncbi:MAG: hypothetical protein ACI9S8_002333 [Chlamydiales bacterium]|jgi:hypothetical protein
MSFIAQDLQLELFNGDLKTYSGLEIQAGDETIILEGDTREFVDQKIQIRAKSGGFFNLQGPATSYKVYPKLSLSAKTITMNCIGKVSITSAVVNRAAVSIF